MLAGILSVYFATGGVNGGTLDIMTIAQKLPAVTFIPMAGIFFLLIIGFAVKLPVFPLHTWLPDAHTDAPTGVSVILAGTLLKMGGYGMIRICVSIFPEVARTYAPLFLTLAVVGIVYGAAVTLRQTDIKRMIAYSSVSHMGLVLLGIFSLSQVSLVGATLQMFSHGVVTGLLFAMAGLVMHNAEERDLRKLGGLAKQTPLIAVIFSVAGLASLGLPLTSGFAAEFLVLVGSYSSVTVAGVHIYTVISALGVVLAAGYILWMIQRVFYGPVLEKFDHVKDADRLEMVYMFILVAVILAVGIYPAILTNMIQGGISPIMSLIR
jgi:NADH-quinone oxidoreductase subunit M